ncbi:uncharacterized protein LOC113512804 [Galleria mellonella]|uniref:Uncharacterized protein LOC113512804 n=1 Tax=Galleria mellonella TaxID=7137 RepID=A0A6J1WMT8_GALME|nr:uncharacterized protein LOC113512804 [Galleria mellonella]
MISHRIRESRRSRLPKMPKNIERLYREGKCRECAVVVTRMDFAKILGKFTKVKIQYESNSTPKAKKNEVSSPNSNKRLKSNENGMVLIHRTAYNQHPVKELLSPKRVRIHDPPNSRSSNNVLKEINRLKKTPAVTDKNSNINISQYDDKRRKNASHLKRYGIIFVDPSTNNNNKEKNHITLSALLPAINKSILPSEEWCIEYFPKNEEPTDDKVYDRIAAELEDLMYNEKPEKKNDTKSELDKNKIDDFPSIMDILNDNSSDNDNKTSDQSSSVEFKTNLESSDVEAMLLGKTEPKLQESTPMEVDTTIMSNLIEDVAQLNAIQGTESTGSNTKVELAPVTPVIDEIENPHSPSILDEALQKGIEEHLPVACDPEPININTTVSDSSVNKTSMEISAIPQTLSTSKETNVILENEKKAENVSVDKKSKQENVLLPKVDVTHVIFKKSVNGTCSKSVKCPKNLKYVIEFDGKTVEFVGAPKFISSLEDLQVLLQIVNDTELNSPYVLC